MESLPGFEPPAGSVPLAPITADEDPWKDIFPAEVHGANRGMDGAIIDHEDGGIRRCAHCLTEIWGGLCQGCGEAYDVDDSEYFSDTPERDLGPVLEYFRQPRFSFAPAPPMPLPRAPRLEYIEESDEEQDAYEDDFINDGEVDYESGHDYEDDGLESDHEHDDIHAHLRAHAQAHMPHYMTHYHPYHRPAPVEEDPIEISEEEDDDDDEEATVHHYVPRRGRVVQGHVIGSDEEDMSEASVEMGHYQPVTRGRVGARQGTVIVDSDEDTNEIEFDSDEGWPGHVPDRRLWHQPVHHAMSPVRLSDNYVTDEDDYEQDMPHWAHAHQEYVDEDAAREHLRRFGILPQDEDDSY
ncbi:hypothetical protein CPB86DRAFT_602984 [Serendipita vermifera]|nr:hypothetical protein CPB86DRAFT_602984 [Serendipita vermifera]